MKKGWIGRRIHGWAARLLKLTPAWFDRIAR
jgi:hypothetical protein